MRYVPGNGDVAVMPLPDGGYGACQVSGVEAKTVTVYALDWRSPTPPTLAQLADAGPLMLDHHVHENKLAHISIDCSTLPVPPGFGWLGHQRTRDGVPASSTAHGGWWYLPIQVSEQRRWDFELPAEAKAAYRAARTRGQVEVDFGAGPTMMGAATTYLDLTAAVPAAGEVRWSALDALPRCTALTWSGADRGLTDAVAARPIVSSLVWRDAPPHVGLTGCGLTGLSLHGPAVRTVDLPRSVTSLQVAGPVEQFAVRAADDGRWIRLAVDVTGPHIEVPAGLRQVRDVVLEVDGMVSVSPLAALVHLETLAIRWRQPPHLLTDAEALGQLSHLHSLQLGNAYGLTADILPDLPALTNLEVDGLPRSAVAPLRARYRATGVRLSVRGAKSDTWLAANITNPFRDWVEDDARGGAAACKAYADALSAIDRLPAEGPRRLDQAQRALDTLVERLNRIDDKYEFIDTLRREEAWDAFAELAQRCAVPADLASTWFDEKRTF